MRTQSFSYLASLAFWSAVVFVPAVFAGGWEQFHATDGNNGRASRGPDLSVYPSPRFQVGSGLGSSTFGFGNTSGPVVDEGKIFCYNAKGAVLTFRE